MEARGYIVRRAAPMYRLLHETGEKTGAVRVRKASELTGKGVLVGYVDEGGDTSHPALPKERIRDKRNFSGDGRLDSVEKEAVSHGTHGMGIVGGQAVPGGALGELSPYVGMAPGVEFAIAKVLSATGGSEATIMAGMEWAASLVVNPLKTPVLLNLSLGGPGSSNSPVARLANQLKLKNIGVIVAAGNSGPLEGTVSTPAHAALVTSIGAVDKDDKLTDYSSRGRKGTHQIRRVNIGGAVFFDRPNLYDIVSALNTRLAKAFEESPSAVKWAGKTLYHALSGTSMAAPHETGQQAVLIERMMQVFTDGLPDGYLFWLDELLDRTAKKLSGYGEHEIGAGRTDLEAALKALDKALKNPDRVRGEAEELMARAREEYGNPGEPPIETPGRFQRPGISSVPSTVASAVLAGLGLFLLP
ncbi:MAG: S8 family serine peptidase, partial [Elusimicrobiota bacterium]